MVLYLVGDDLVLGYMCVKKIRNLEYTCVAPGKDSF